MGHYWVVTCHIHALQPDPFRPPAAPAPAPTATPVPIAPPQAVQPGDAYTTAASGLLAGSALESAIANICEMGFPREEASLLRHVPRCACFLVLRQLHISSWDLQRALAMVFDCPYPQC